MPPSSTSVSDFQQLAVQSGLATPALCRQWLVEYQKTAVAADADSAESLAQWLVAHQRMSRYQAKLLLAGKAGPFLYGAYELVEKADEAAVGGCYRGRQSSSGHPVLLQFISSSLTRSPQTWAALEPWLLCLTQVRHPNLHAWYEYQAVDAYKFLVLEELEGRPLPQVLAEGRLEPARACWLAQQIAQAAQTLHQAGLIHGHIRPDQIWQEPMGTVKLLLHGLVPQLASDETDELTRADYLAPELALPGSQPTMQSDVYALGCCLYHMLAGRPPFAGDSVAEKMKRHAAEAIQPLENLGVPKEIAQLVTYMMAKNPSVRYAALDQVIPTLAHLAGDEAHRMPPQPPPATLREFLEYLDHQAAALPAPAAAPTAPPQAAPPIAPPAAPPAAPAIAPAAPVAVRQPIVAPVVAQPAAPIQPVTPPAAQPVIQPAASPPRLAIDIRTDPRRRRRSNSWTLGIIAVSILVIVGVGGFAWMKQRSSPAVQEEPPSPETPITDMPPDSGGGSSTAGSSLIDDDGKTLWASPTSGSPIDFRYLPPESLLLVVLRPAELAAHPEGPRLLQALGPKLGALMTAWSASAKVAWENIEQLHISLHDAGEAFPRPAFVVRLKQGLPRSDLLAGWGNPTEKTEGEGKYLAGAEWSFFVPPQAAPPTGTAEAGDNGGGGDTIRLFAMGTEAEIKLVAERGGAPPPPRSGMDPLYNVSDDRRLATIFFVPHFLRSQLLRDGREFYFGPARKLREPLDAFLGDGIRAGMASVHLSGNQFYVELAVTGDVTRDRFQLASDLRDRLNKLPLETETYLARLAPPEYWRRVSLRLPMMVRYLHDQSRVQVENNVAILNAVLPDVAAHNLAFGGEMMLASQPGAASQVAGSIQPQPPATLEELLDRKLTVRIDQTSIEFAFRDIATDVKDSHPGLKFPFDIVLIGADMEKDGITKNQSIANFSIENAPLAEVLTALVMRGNPVTTVTSPTDKDQKLVWALGDDPDMAGRRVILITTRDGAAKRNIPLPKVFEPAP